MSDPTKCDVCGVIGHRKLSKVAPVGWYFAFVMDDGNGNGGDAIVVTCSVECQDRLWTKMIDHRLADLPFPRVVARMAVDVPPSIPQKLDTRHGAKVTLYENRGGWRYVGLSGTCIAISARDEYMLIEVDHDPVGYWPVGSRVMVELGESRPGANDRTTAAFARVS